MTRRELQSGIPPVEFSPDRLVEIIEWLTPERLAQLIDATDLKADTPEDDLRGLAEQAIRHGFQSVCVNPGEVEVLPRWLAGTGVKECYVIDFPLGRSTSEMKAFQAGEVVRQSRTRRGEGPGWVELDMVINVGRFKTDPTTVRREVAAVVEAADSEQVKVIIRSSELTREEIVVACRMAKEARAAFLKNGTGMEAFGATPEHIAVMREAVGAETGVKAAGGIRDAMDVVRLMAAGAGTPKLRTPEHFRIGTSSPVKILSTLEQVKQDPGSWVETALASD